VSLLLLLYTFLLPEAVKGAPPGLFIATGILLPVTVLFPAFHFCPLCKTSPRKRSSKQVDDNLGGSTRVVVTRYNSLVRAGRTP
jgi:hypothetical protein